VDERWIRVSDEERESVVGLLREAYARGRLDHGEFDERSTAAYGAKTWGELEYLIADLPRTPTRYIDLPAVGVTRPGTCSKTAARPRRGPLLMMLTAVVGLIIAVASSASQIAVLLVLLLLCSLQAALAPRR
jgi:hypothetical protein